MHLTLALSISGSINKTSVVVAIASLLGVALLALLFFAQAREVKRLREWASAASEREAELEARIVAGIRAQQARAAQRPQGAAPVPRTTPLLSRESLASAGSGAAPGVVLGGASTAAPAGAAVAAAAAGATAVTRVASVADLQGGHAVNGVQATSPGTAVPGLPVAGEASAAGAPALPDAAGATALADAAEAPARDAEAPAREVPDTPAVGAADALAPGALAAAAAGTPAAAGAPAAPSAPAEAPAAQGLDAAAPGGLGAVPAAASAPASAAPTGAAVPTLQPPLQGAPADGLVSVSPRPVTAAGTSPRPARPPAPPAPPQSRGGEGLRETGAPEEPRPPRRTVDVGARGRRDSEEGAQGRPVGRQATIYRKERSSSRMLAIVGGGAVLLLLVVVLLVSLVSSGSSNPTPASKAADAHRANTLNVSSTKGTLDVAVLNATETNGLAGQFANKLKSGGYAHARALYGTPSGTYPATTVQYARGYESEAMSIAHLIGVPSSQVQALQPSTQPLAAGASVVVIVGQSAAGAGQATESSEGGESNAATGETAEGATGETAEGTTGEGTEETAYGGEVPPESQTAEEGA